MYRGQYGTRIRILMFQFVLKFSVPFIIIANSYRHSFGGQFTLSTQLINYNYLIVPSTDAAQNFL